MDKLLNIESIKDQLWVFLTGREFIIATSIFFGYLVITGIVRRIVGFFGFLLSIVFGVFSPLKIRRVFVNTLSLVFMVTSFAMCGGTSAKLAGREGNLEAILGGSIALGVWSIIVLIFHLLREYGHNKPSIQRPSVFASRSEKVKPPTAFGRIKK